VIPGSDSRAFVYRVPSTRFTGIRALMPTSTSYLHVVYPEQQTLSSVNIQGQIIVAISVLS
jgi:hypothetical protein